MSLHDAVYRRVVSENGKVTYKEIPYWDTVGSCPMEGIWLVTNAGGRRFWIGKEEDLPDPVSAAALFLRVDDLAKAISDSGWGDLLQEAGEIIHELEKHAPPAVLKKLQKRLKKRISRESSRDLAHLAMMEMVRTDFAKSTG